MYDDLGIRREDNHVTMFYNGSISIGAYYIYRISFDPKVLQFITFSEN